VVDERIEGVTRQGVLNEALFGADVTFYWARWIDWG